MLIGSNEQEVETTLDLVLTEMHTREWGINIWVFFKTSLICRLIKHTTNNHNIKECEQRASHGWSLLLPEDIGY